MTGPTTTIEIREAQPEDGPALMGAIETINTETEFLGVPGERLRWAERAEEELRGWRERGTATYVLALDQGEIIGYLGAFAGGFSRSRGTIWIGHVGIRTAWRGRGIGARLFEAIETWARARGAWRLELRVDTQNARGLALYRKRGFACEGTIPFAAPYGETWHTHLWMGKKLGPDLPPCAAVDPAPGHGRPDIESIVLRPLRADDAAAVWAWEGALLEGTTLFMTQQSDRTSVAEMEKRIVASTKNLHAVEFVASVERAGEPMQVIGLCGILVETQFRMAHDGFVSIAVLPAYWGGGLGRRLAAMIEDWARTRQLRRLSSAVMAHNIRGYRFAMNLGFAVEARSAGTAVIDRHRADRIRLGKILQA